MKVGRAALVVLALGCQAPEGEDPAQVGLALLGFADDSLAPLEQVVATKKDGLRAPRDLDFNPEQPGELWVVNADSDAVTVVFGATSSAPAKETYYDPYALHFMDNPSAIAFGDVGTFGTCQESRNTYAGSAPPNDFMGPTLWSSDLEIFAQSNPEAVEYLSDQFGMHVDLGSHLDMLHESPQCMGIAWESANVYWVFDGFNGNIVRYDFQHDHGPGYDDHSDGLIWRVKGFPVARKAGVPSHLAFDQETGLLYVADTGNNRILAFDTRTGERGATLPAIEPGTDHAEWVGMDVYEVVNGEEAGLQAPSGLALQDGLLWVSDFETGIVTAFDRDGQWVDDWDTQRGEGGVAGLTVWEDSLWLVDPSANEVVRLSPGEGAR